MALAVNLKALLIRNGVGKAAAAVLEKACPSETQNIMVAQGAVDADSTQTMADLEANAPAANRK